jgi:hypothetical protein
MTFATILTPGQQDATVDVAGKPQFIDRIRADVARRNPHYVDLHHQDGAGKLLKPRCIA